MNRYLLILGFSIFFPFSAFSQVTIGGTVNSYYKVNTLVNGTNNVTCDVAPGLVPGDKVLLIQMTGASFSGFNMKADGSSPVYSNAGTYEFLSVLSVAGTVVTFTANLKRTYTPGEKIQLVKVFEAESARVTSLLTAKEWDGNTGGIIALVILKKLILSADISVNGVGFRGYEPPNYYDSCRLYFDTDTFYFSSAYQSRAGFKGEGMMSVSLDYPRGIGNAVNGGGGGAGLYGGGAGGSNYLSGGAGGQQTTNCASSEIQYARGGLSLYNFGYYSNNNFITMGGGGGSTTWKGTITGKKGGDGGGIVFILTDTLQGNDYHIYANGLAANNSDANGSGGSGGGAGGSILIDAAAYSGDLNLEAKGGKGGNPGAASCGGGGGGGSGGVIWFSGESLPASVTTTVIGGSFGNAIEPCGVDGYAGFNGTDTLSSLKPILNGFLFNAVRESDTICEGMAPGLLVGTTPKGAGTFSYVWLESTDNSNWSVITSATSKDYQPPVLNSTRYYTRVVNSAGIADTAISVRIFVYTAIQDNYLLLRDTICAGVNPGLLHANTLLTGGNGTYSYIWQSKTGVGNWSGTIGTAAEHNETNNLNSTTYYRRIAISDEVCRDTSDVDTMTVLPQIANNNFITSDTTICNGQDAGSLTLNAVSGGDSQFNFSWLVSTNNISFSPIGGATSVSYNPGNLSADRYYKRIVYSGNDNACIDTSDTRTIDVLPLITNNIISSARVLYCFNEDAEPITGLNPGGGSVGNYNYQWLLYNGSQYLPISGANLSTFDPSNLTSNAQYRRQVISGNDNACIDTSNALLITVVPEITNTLSSGDETICENFAPAPFNEIPATGGTGTFTYEWVYKKGSGSWSTAPGISNGVSYTSPIINDFGLYYYSRIATSSICDVTSDSITINIHPSISNNSIGNANQFVCFDTEKEIIGTLPVGGNGTYSYTWQFSLDESAWNTISGNVQTLTTSQLTTPTYYRRLVFSGAAAQCKDTSATALINIYPLPTGNILSLQDTLCENGDLIIQYQSLTGNSPWNLVISDGNQSFNFNGLNAASGNLTCNPVSVNPVTSTTFILSELNDNNGCEADLSSNLQAVDAVIYKNPTANIIDEESEVCGLEFQLSAETPAFGEGEWQISSGGSFNDASLPNALVTSDLYGTQVLEWIVSNWTECIDRDDISITFYEQPVEIDAGDDITTINYDTTLNASPALVGEGYWQTIATGKESEMADSTLYNTNIHFSSGEGEYRYLWSITNGVCEIISDSLLILVTHLDSDEGFSPDGNGINDLYIYEFPRGINATFIVFNRNGEEIITIRSTDGSGKIIWDGTDGIGNDIPDDTYFFIFKRDDGVDPEKGFIELRRIRK